MNFYKAPNFKGVLYGKMLYMEDSSAKISLSETQYDYYPFKDENDDQAKNIKATIKAEDCFCFDGLSEWLKSIYSNFNIHNKLSFTKNDYFTYFIYKNNLDTIPNTSSLSSDIEKISNEISELEQKNPGYHYKLIL